ncbi:Peptide methionine sulfoxide reductase B3 [Perkinsus olseni]|uniref:Peptide methionine sulfoxide reductase B3 n=1 Tax=Perkinsus olseni TaxID=32597 RepID=A0A7J6MDC4_PEROL|nr:Peptide methionine sulfoxide reductase B3 [Perkinsus olseni]
MHRSSGRLPTSKTVLEVDGSLDKGDEYFRAKLTPTQFKVLRQAATEPRGVTLAKGGWDDNYADGTYLCGACESALYDSSHKFDCGCGWPGYWTNIDGAVAERSETDGSGRTEILCAKCGSHLGHVFRGEGMGYPTDERHCVNGTSLSFKPRGSEEVKRSSYSGSPMAILIILVEICWHATPRREFHKGDKGERGVPAPPYPDMGDAHS